ncbi:MAG: hypothetical protein RL617_140 [Pseudomonadota bacterium]
MLPAGQIRVRGARTHNLKCIDLDIPRQKLVVITGLSGSGKSSLAFDTLYAEGQRRYVESLSAYARQFLHLMAKPDVDSIEGLSPAIAIEQKANNHNPRSTVGTITEVSDYLRLLFARAGVPHCPSHPTESLEAKTISQMVDECLSMPEGTRMSLLAPVIQDEAGDHQALIEGLRAQGFVRLRVARPGGTLQEFDIDSPLPIPPKERKSVWVVTDRLRVKDGIGQRLAESLELSLRLGQGNCLLSTEDESGQSVQSRRLSMHLSCGICGREAPALEPNLFSFNSPNGACPSCDGLGEECVFESDLVVQFPHLSLSSGAIPGWDERNNFAWSLLQSLAKHYGFGLDQPFETLSPDVQAALLFGSGETSIALAYPLDRGRQVVKQQPFEGILANLKRRWEETDSPAVREELGKYRRLRPCQACNGSRLRPEARAVRLGQGEQSIGLPELVALPLGKVASHLDALALSGQRASIAQRILEEIRSRLLFLNNVGLSYLSLNRPAVTLSGGESQRIRLASQIGAQLSGVMYVLDEPSIGLHQRDNDRLLETLRRLRDLGNTVIVVEHDEDAIRTADHIIDMGPGAGSLGGEVVAHGPLEVILQSDGLTGQYLSGRCRIEPPKHRHTCDGRWLRIQGASGNNLRAVDVDFPVGLFSCVTGVSGSGKSTLVNETLARIVAKHLYGSREEPTPYVAIEGLEHIDRLICVDQSPIGRTPRSNPATYTGLFTPIRDLFAGSPMARERGYDAGRFSFNVKGGRCEGCQGDGLVKVEMHFLPDLYVPCDQCKGLRYNRETLDVRYRGKTIAEVLDLTIDDASAFFAAIPTVARKLETLREVGLGYLRLGQSATTLSGGEAQRVKLACELSKRDTGRTLYILDEPTTGLHFHDTAMLLKLLHHLRDAGNTIVVIEHNLDVIQAADWIIDMGPDGGEGGGELVASGTPESVAANPKSVTGRYLLPMLEKS